MRRIPVSGLILFMLHLMVRLPGATALKFTEVASEGGHCAVARVAHKAGWVAAGVGENFMLINTAAPGDGVLGRIRLPGRILDIAVVDSFAYVTCAYGGLRVLDLSQPASIKETARDTFTTHAGGIYVSGKHVFVCDSHGKKLRAYDASIPGVPVALKPFAVQTYPAHFSMQGNRGYLSCESFKILDMSDLENPIQLTPATYGGHENHIVLDSLAIHIGGGIARITNIADPRKIQEVSMIKSNPEPYGCEYRGGLALNGKTLYISTCDSAYNSAVRGTLRAFDISNPAQPVALCTLALASSPAEISLSGNRALVAVGPGGFQIADITHRDSLPLAASHPFPHAQDVAVIGTFAYGVDPVTGVNAYDVSRPDAPRWVGQYLLRGARFIEAQGNRLFVLGDSLLMLDATDPTRLERVGWATRYIRAMSASGSRVAGIGGFSGGLSGPGSEVEILDFSAPGLARLVKRFYVQNYTETVALAGDTLFVSGDANTLASYKLADTAEPVKLITYGGSPKDIALSGDYLYISVQNEGLRIFNRQTGKLVGSYDKSTIGPDKLLVAPGAVYMLGSYNGGSFEAVDVSNPSLPIQAGFQRLPSEASGAAWLNGHILVATDKAGLGIWRSESIPLAVNADAGLRPALPSPAAKRARRDLLGRKKIRVSTPQVKRD